MTKQFDQLLAQDLPALNESLKTKGQQPIESPPTKIAANENAVGLGGSNSGVNALTHFEAGAVDFVAVRE